MIILPFTFTPHQHDFFGEAYRENCYGEVGPATQFARAHGFTYAHLSRLWPSYHHSWDGNFSTWDPPAPPKRPLPQDFPFTPQELVEIMELPLFQDHILKESPQEIPV